MAKAFYQIKASGAELHITDDPQVILRADLEAALPALVEIQSLGDALRTAIAVDGLPSLGLQRAGSLADFDDALDDERQRVSDVLDYFDYSARVESLTVRDGDWFSPEAVEQFSDETVGGEAVLAIDGVNSTWWQSEASGERSITFRIRDYKKRLEGIRLRSTSGDLRAQLQGVEIRASGSLGGIDDPTNVVATGVDFTHTGDDWIEALFTANGRRYIKLVFSSTLNGNDQARIREIGVRVGITNHSK